MIRGAVDYITPQAIGGWIFSDIASVKDRLVLAFWKNECIGSGTVELYREDLAQAGLGDGYLGFNFPIGVPDGVDPAEVFIKLSDSDFILKQSSVQLSGSNTASASNARSTGGAFRSSVWMRERGWIRQDECDFLTQMDTLGIYSRIVSKNEISQGPNDEDKTPATTVLELFELYYQAHLDLKVSYFSSVSEAITFIKSGDCNPLGWNDGVVALWSRGTTTISVQEASHRIPVSRNESFSGIDYCISQNRLAIINSRSDIRPKNPAPSAGLLVFFASNIS